MERGFWFVVRRAVLLCALLLSASPAAATGFGPGSQCHAAAAAHESYAAVAADPARWTCGSGNWSIAADRVFLRFDLRGTDRSPVPDRFDTRIARFAALDLLTFETSGRVAHARFALDDMTASQTRYRMSAPLPGRIADAVAVVAQFDRPAFAGVLSEARIVPAAVVARATFPSEDLLLAAMIGLLISPMLFNLAFYRVLRQRFMLWQALVIGFTIIHTAIVSGLAHRVLGLPPSVLVPASILSFGGGIAGATMFSSAFIERAMLDRRHRLALHAGAAWTVLTAVLYAFTPGWLRTVAPPVYFSAFLPLFGVFGWTLAVALRRGSRSARFQLAAWLPMMGLGLVRIASNAFTSGAPIDAFWVQHVAVMLEVSIAALGVADRLMTLRTERDRARSEARLLATEVDLDGLTGLLNRRAFEQNFARFRDDGFTTMAALDLDHFKSINDGHGHAAGDAVLRAVALALDPDADTVVARYGGEEFVLLLRGPDATARAERRRCAIPARVAGAVPGLQRIVTASMGLVEQSASVAASRDFAALFAHCDRLLYEAKDNGRNQTMSERLQGFAERRHHGDRRASAARRFG